MSRQLVFGRVVRCALSSGGRSRLRVWRGGIEVHGDCQRAFARSLRHGVGEVYSEVISFSHCSFGSFASAQESLAAGHVAQELVANVLMRRLLS
jgi:hypothetical protein